MYLQRDRVSLELSGKKFRLKKKKSLNFSSNDLDNPKEYCTYLT